MGQEKGNPAPLDHTEWVPGAKYSPNHTYGTKICSLAITGSQGASLEAGDKLGSQGQQGIPNPSLRSLPSSTSFLATQKLRLQGASYCFHFFLCLAAYPRSLSRPKGVAIQSLSTHFIEETSARIKGGSWAGVASV